MLDLKTLGFELLIMILSVGSILLFLYIFYLWAGRREKKRVDTYICPRCGSLNIIHQKHRVTDTPFIGSLLPSSVFVCLDCDFEGTCPLVLKSDVEKFRKELQKNLKEEKETKKSPES